MNITFLPSDAIRTIYVFINLREALNLRSTCVVLNSDQCDAFQVRPGNYSHLSAEMYRMLTLSFPARCSTLACSPTENQQAPVNVLCDPF
jgi:hypothetical protein